MNRQAWLASVRDFAASRDGLKSVWLFGSRARGDFSDESDLDLAFELVEEDEESAFNEWLDLQDAIQEELAPLVGVSLDAQWFHRTATNKVVVPAVLDHGVLLWSR